MGELPVVDGGSKGVERGFGVWEKIGGGGEGGHGDGESMRLGSRSGDI